MTIISRNAVRVHLEGRSVTLHQGERIELISASRIDVGTVKLRAWRPDLSPSEERLYRRNADKFSRDVLDALPKLPLNLSTSSNLTLDLRFGKNHAIYKREEVAPISSGSFATVIKVRELQSQRVYAAKIPHFRSSDSAGTARKRWESLKEEFDKITKLRHVSHLL